MKICSRCREEKHTDAFYRNSSRLDGLSYWCKKCHDTHINAKKQDGYQSTYDRHAGHRPHNITKGEIHRSARTHQALSEPMVITQKDTVDTKWSLMLSRLKETGKVRT